jgi:hypothetical protein
MTDKKASLGTSQRRHWRDIINNVLNSIPKHTHRQYYRPGSITDPQYGLNKAQSTVWNYEILDSAELL